MPAIALRFRATLRHVDGSLRCNCIAPRAVRYDFSADLRWRMSITRNGGLMTACTQPGCNSTIVDNYCEVCGSPAGAAPFFPRAAASATSPAPTDEPGLTASIGNRDSLGAENRESHDGLYAARMYRHDRRQLLRHLRESRGRSPVPSGSGSERVTRSCRRAWPNGSPGADTRPCPY